MLNFARQIAAPKSRSATNARIWRKPKRPARLVFIGFYPIESIFTQNWPYPGEEFSDELLSAHGREFLVGGRFGSRSLGRRRKSHARLRLHQRNIGTVNQT